MSHMSVRASYQLIGQELFWSKDDDGIIAVPNKRQKYILKSQSSKKKWLYFSDLDKRYI